MGDSNQATLEDLNVIGETGPTPLRTRVLPIGGHPSDSSSDEHMPSQMLRSTYSNQPAGGAFVGPTYRPLSTQQYPAKELRMEEGVSRSTWHQTYPNESQMMDAVEWTAIDGSRVHRVRVVDFQMDASLAMAQLRDLTETFTGYGATMEEITDETIMAIHQLRQWTDGVRQTTMQSLDLHLLAGHRLHLRFTELKDLMEKVMCQVETLSGAQVPGRACLDNWIDTMENQLDVLKSVVAALEQEIASLSQARGDHLQGLGEIQARVQSTNAKAHQADEAVRAASDQLKVISSKMDQTAASVVAQAKQYQLQMEEIKAIETRLSQLEALGATNEAAGSADPSQVNVLLEFWPDLNTNIHSIRGPPPTRSGVRKKSSEKLTIRLSNWESGS